MQKDYFFNGGGAPPSPPPPPLQFEWNSNWGCSQDQYAQFGSGVSGGYAVRELIGNKRGPPPPFAADMSANYNNVNNYNTDPSLRVPILGNSPLPLNPPPLSGGGAGEITAAKLSCLGNRSFNSRTGQFGLKNGDLPCRSNALQCIGNPKLPRVSSTPSLKQAGSPVQNKNPNPTRPESDPAKNSDDEFPVPDQLPTGPKSSIESNPRKRKPLSKNSEEDDGKGTEFDDQTTAKRPKSVEATVSDNNGVKTEDELINTANNTINNANNAGDIKPPEPPKDYIHVRARRGQATDSHSLAERVRREKIGERMKLLQDLVPGCSKVTGKALMLDEIINYVQSLQRQVEFLSMKLATVNPRLDLNIDNLLTKDICQSNNVSLPHTMYPLDSSAPAFHGQEQYPPDQIPQLHTNLVNGEVSQRPPIYPLDSSPSHNLGLQFPPVDGFDKNLAQFPSVFEDDLQSIVHMGFNRL